MTEPEAPHGDGAVDRLAVAAERAATLVEALPYIRKFWGQVVVVKYGGNVLRPKDGDAVDESTALASFAEDIVLLRSVGMLPVVVHGGGPQIGELMARGRRDVACPPGRWRRGWPACARGRRRRRTRPQDEQPLRRRLGLPTGGPA